MSRELLRRTVGVVVGLCCLLSGGLPSASVANAESVSDPEGEFTPLSPARVLDTRTGEGRSGAVGPVAAGSPIDVQITGRGGVAPNGVSAVVMNVTVTQPTDTSHLTIWPTGTGMASTSNLNFVPGQTVPNLVTVAVGPDGRVFLANAFGSVHVIFDVVGFYSGPDGGAGSRFHAIAPARLFDTRSDVGGVGVAPLGPAGTLRFDVRGQGGVPGTGVDAVVMNVTVAGPDAASHLTVYPDDVGAIPNASNLNFVPGLTVPNLVVVRVPGSGIVAFHNAFGNVHVIADVVGYYNQDRSTEAGRFIALEPYRAFDSRVDGDGSPLTPAEAWLIGDFPGFGGIPLGEAEAALLNVTAVAATEPTHLTVFPSDNCSIPNASNLNVTPGRTVPNQVVARLGPTDGCNAGDELETIAIYNHAGFVHVVIDVFGIFTSASTSLWT
jgi:hypothetical protein